MEAGMPALAPVNAATCGGMYCARVPVGAALGYQSCITSERGSRPFDPGSDRVWSTSSTERVPTGYAPVGAGMTSVSAALESCTLAVVVADAVAAVTIPAITTTPTTRGTRRVGPPACATWDASAE